MERRAAIAVVVVAAHVALIWVVGRATRRPVAEVVELTLFALPISPQEWRSEPITPERTDRQKNAATASAEQTRSPTESERRRRANERRRAADQAREAAAPLVSADSGTALAESPALNGELSASSTPPAKVDWFGEAHAAVGALTERGRTASERTTLDGRRGVPMDADEHGRPPCPFEKCEPGWGAPPTVFDSKLATKAGRIEKSFDDEVIRWISNRCYQILVTPNPMHRGMTKCVTPLRKSKPRGDLFKDMKKVPPPEKRSTDVP